MATLVLLATLTGCIGKGDEDPIEDSSTNATDETVIDEGDLTTAPDGRGEISAFQETNKTEAGTGSMNHQHDYWQGKERLESVAWIRAGLIPIPLLPCKKPGGGCTAGGTTPGTDTYPALTTIADFDLAPPPTMGMIYEGTKTVELMLTDYTGPCRTAPTGERVCSPPNPAGKVYFDYLAANDEPGAFRTGGELIPNQPFPIDIAATDADMPHQTKSLWIFRIYSNEEMVWFNFNITISLVKGYDVVDWPPHPDLYADKATREVFNGPVHLESKGSVDGFVFGSDAGWINPQRVISWNTDRVAIDITGVAFAAQVEVAPAGFVLEYRNASTPFLMANGVAYGGRLDDPGSDGSTYHFEIDLVGDRGDAYDTPYAQYSRWGFRLVPYWEGDPVTGGSCIDEAVFPGILFGCQWIPWSMDYTMVITASGHPSAPEQAPPA